MKIVVLDGYTENPGDLSWKDLESLGETTIYDRTPVELVEERIGDAEIVITNKTPIDKEIFEKCFKLVNNKCYQSRFIFTYFNETAKRSIIKNLAIILGKDELVELTGQKRVVFVQSQDVDGMRELLLK